MVAQTSAATTSAVSSIKAIAASILAALGIGSDAGQREPTEEERQAAAVAAGAELHRRTRELVAVESPDGRPKTAVVLPGASGSDPHIAPAPAGDEGKRISEPDSRAGQPLRAPGRERAPVAAPGADTGSGPMLAGPLAGQARFVYDSTIARYRDTQTGRIVAQVSLPWPTNEGFASRRSDVLAPGTIVDRYGRPSGRYAGEPGATVSERGLPPGSDALDYRTYEVVKPLPAEVGPAAGVKPFGAKGGATQYYFKRSISDLLKSGHLREIP